MTTSPTLPHASDPAGGPPLERRPARDRGPVRVIEPRPRGFTAPAREGWRARRLWPFFSVRLLEKLYQRTWLGILWLPLRPGLDLLLKVGVIGTLIGSPAPGVPYLLYAIIGMAVWEFFEKLAFWGTRSLETNRSLLRRAYVPRVPMLFGALTPATVFLGMYLIATLLICAFYLVTDGTTHLQFGIETLGAVAGMVMLAAWGLLVGMFLSPIGLYARDVRFVLGYVMGFWFYVTPILYDAETATGAIGAAVTANPISAPILLVKHGVLGTPLPSTAAVAVSIGLFCVLLPFAMVFYGRAEAASASGR